MCFVMHVAGTGYLRALATAEQQERYSREVVEHGKLFSVAASEAASGQNFMAPQQVASRVQGGYAFSGVKSFATSAGAADYYVINAWVEDPVDPARSVNLFVVPGRDDPHVRVREAWDALGMRATASHELVFDALFIDETARLGPHGEGLLRMRQQPSWTAIGLIAPFVGIAGAARDYAVSHARTRVVQPQNRPLGHFQAIRFLLAEMSIGLSTAQAMLYRAAQVADRDPAHWLQPALEAKYVAATQAVAVADRALQVCGGQGYSRHTPIERYYRDARAGAVMAVTTEACREQIGWALLEMDPSSAD